MTLTAKAKFLYFALMCFCDTAGRTILRLDVFLRQFAYSDFTTEEEVYDALKLLEKNGLIIIYPYSAEDYSVDLIQIKDYHKMQKGKAYNEKLSELPPPDNYCIGKNTESNGDELIKDDRFDVFYDSYPRKYKRPEALNAWKAINPDDDEYRLIMNGLSEWIPYYSKIESKFIPMASSFLTNQTYLDLPPTDPSVQKEKERMLEHAQLLQWSHDDPSIYYDENTNQFYDGKGNVIRDF